MPSRLLMIDGVSWRVTPCGFITHFDADEFALSFTRGSGDTAEVRVTRYSPQGTMSREASLAELSDAELRTLFGASQPSATSPEAGYRT